MSRTEILRRRVGLSEVGIVCFSVISLLALPVSVLAWVIAFDTTGLDRSAPTVLFTTVLPSASVALLPAAVARYLYDERTALQLWAAMALLATAFVAYGCSTMQGTSIC